VPFLQKQLKNLKDVLKKCLDKRKRLTKSGAAALTLPKCQYFDQMAFLHEKSVNKQTESNLSFQAAVADVSVDIPPTEELSPLASPVSTGSFSVKTVQKRKRRADSSESGLSKSLADCDELIAKSLREENDEDCLYCRSLIPIMNELPKKQKRLAKIKISQLLYDIQYGEEENT